MQAEQPVPIEANFDSLAELPGKLRVLAASGSPGVRITIGGDVARNLARIVERGLAVAQERAAADSAWRSARRERAEIEALLADAAGLARETDRRLFRSAVCLITSAWLVLLAIAIATGG